MTNSLDQFSTCVDNSWVKNLTADPETDEHKPNKTSREVKSGHYVLVKPTPLPDPKLVHISRILAEELNLSSEECINDDRFVQLFSGNMEALENFTQSWATPYALAIYGQDYIQNCPFGTGNGYGDGRAISIGEVLLPNGKRWEFQLKGGGRTPFCRGADGRAVLRSSVREFLASEAMFCLNVSTTRAISLCVSQSEIVKRPWYKEEKKSISDAQLQKLANYPPEYREYIMSQLAAQLQQPNVMIDNAAAITCRVAPSFLRVGHIQLFERRARKDSSRIDELKALVSHALYREYPEINEKSISFEEKVVLMIKEASKKFLKLTRDWIRVGFCQGNFNSDNCLISGRTMDYGPFGFIERFEPLWNMWSGGGEHFGFLNQPIAGFKNFTSLCKAVEPLLPLKWKMELEDVIEDHGNDAKKSLKIVWGEKLGFTKISPNSFIDELVSLLEKTQSDYTIFWRQLAQFNDKFFDKSTPVNEEDVLSVFQNTFYEPLSDSLKGKFVDWLNRYVGHLKTDLDQSGLSIDETSTNMRKISPKYIPREWMLVRTYTDAMKGDYGLLKELYELFLNPYDEQPEYEEKYYKKAPIEVYEGFGLGGTAFMT